MIKADTAGIGNLARDIARVAGKTSAVFSDSASNVAKKSAPLAVDEITAVYNISQKRTEPAVNAKATGPVVYTFSKARAASLKEFGGEQVARGYSAKLKRSGRAKVVRGGFAAAKFKGLPLKRVGAARYPLKVLYGTKFSSMIRNKEVRPRFTIRQSEAARIELERQMAILLDKM